jgi:large subunit ribosomal protein L37Ae
MASRKSTKRFGARYGRKIKDNLQAIENKKKGPQKCPFCLSTGSKRVAAGIWFCKKCNSKFTGRAYSV